jgi:hypothetical protein
MAKAPTNELATMSWLRTLPGISHEMVGTKRLDPELMPSEGFLTVRTVGGSSNIYIPQRSPVMQITAFAFDINGDRRDPPWAAAVNLLEEIREYCMYEQFNFKGVIPTENGYDDVCVQSANPLTEPAKVPGDDARMAEYTMDVQINWTRRKVD